MLKKVLLLLFVSFGLSHIVFAGFEINDITMNVCNDGTGKLTDNYFMQANPGAEKELCLYFTNKSNDALMVSYDFLGSFATEIGIPICNGGNTPFAAFFPDTSKRIITLTGKSNTIIKEKIVVPFGMSGMQYGCVQYGVAPSDSIVPGQMFAIAYVHALFVKIFVGGKADIKKSVVLLDSKGDFFSSNKKIKIFVDENDDLHVALTVRNDGNVTQGLSLSGIISNFLGYEKIFEPTEYVLNPGQDFEFVKNVGKVPGYKGFFDVQFSLQATPAFGFDASVLGEGITDPLRFVEQGTVFIPSWFWLALIIIILLILVKMIFFRKRQS